MKIFSSLKNSAIKFLEPYKTKEPATYAAAQQAVGAILITDGLIGIDNPLGGKKRPGIFGTIGGIVVGIIFMFIPIIFGTMSGVNQMTATASATVVSVGVSTTTSTTSSTSTNSSGACSLTAKYTVDGKDYTQQSSMSSSDNCSLTQGRTIDIKYNPDNPGSWAYGTQSLGMILQIFFWAGLLVLLGSIVTFVIRLLSIIFGWKLIKDGRKNAANLPAGTNLETIIDEVKQNFAKSAFNFGGASGVISAVENIAKGTTPQASAPVIQPIADKLDEPKI